MTDKPILFSAPMIRALLAGTKTQTRRKLSIKGRKGFFQFGASDLPDYDWTFRRADHVWEDWRHDQLLGKLPIASGDRLWVKETFQTGIWRGQEPQVTYRATMEWPWDGHWRSPIFMPRKLSRLTLTVTDVRVQRLQDISEADAEAEGCTEGHTVDDISGVHEGWSASTDFRTLWNSIHGPDAWDQNPWVAAYSFDVHRGNIDQMDT